jgi:hypothetical protein
MEAMLGAFPTAFDKSLDWPDFATAVPIAESKGLAEDLGVFADPKEAKAPEPRPKALEAPLVGETRPPPGVVLKGFGLLEDGVSPPWRFGKEALRLKESPLDP